MSSELVAENADNSLLSIITDFKLVVKKYASNPAKSMSWTSRLLEFFAGITSNRSAPPLFFFLCLQGAVTAWTLQCELDVSEDRVHRALRHLKAIGVIEPAIKVSHRTSKGGPRPTVWILLGSSPEDIARAMRRHTRLQSPKFRVAEDIAQTILEDYITKRQVTEITYKEILVVIKELKVPFRVPDIAELTANCLSERGIKVWR